MNKKNLQSLKIIFSAHFIQKIYTFYEYNFTFPPHTLKLMSEFWISEIVPHLPKHLNSQSSSRFLGMHFHPTYTSPLQVFLCLHPPTSLPGFFSKKNIASGTAFWTHAIYINTSCVITNPRKFNIYNSRQDMLFNKLYSGINKYNLLKIIW